MKELVMIQSELKAPKNQYNSFGGYKYRSLEDILEALKPLLHKHKSYLIISDEIVQIGDRFYVKATAKLINEKGESIESTAYAREPLSKKKMDEAQVTGASSSYARKYALNGLFAIDDTKDADATNTHEEIKIITNEQVLELEKLISETKTDKEKFLQFFKIKSLEEMKENVYQKAVAVLMKKIKKGAA